MSKLRILTLAGFTALLATGIAQAQTNSLFGSSGPTSSSAGRTSSSALGTSALGTSTQGRTGTSATGLGQTGTGALGTQTGQTGGFVGRGNAAGGFVGQQNGGQTTGGARSAQTSTFRGVNRTTTRGNTANRATTNRGGTGQFNSGFGGGQQGNQTRDAIRPVTVVAFNYPRHVATRVNTAVVARFARVTARTPQFRSISATLDGDFEVVLSGTVDSETTKTLAENLARMEPGVKRVRNQLVVQK